MPPEVKESVTFHFVTEIDQLLVLALAVHLRRVPAGVDGPRPPIRRSRKKPEPVAV